MAEGELGTPNWRPVTLPATEEVDANWRKIVREVVSPNGADYVILRNGEPVAVMMDWNSYEYMSKL